MGLKKRQVSVTDVFPFKGFRPTCYSWSTMRGIPSDRLLAFHGDTVLPPDFRLDRETEAVVDREVRVYRQFQKVRAGGAVGFRFRLGPVVTDYFVGNREPTVDPKEGPLRRVTWQPTSRNDIPPGWRPSLIRNTLKRSGFTRLDGSPDYRKTWTQHARRHVRKWEQQTEWEIREVELRPFLEAYWKSPKDPVLKGMFKHFLKKKVEADGPLVHLAAAVRRSKPEEIGAGFAFVDAPEANMSIHAISFIRGMAKDSSAGHGLIDYWFQHARKTGIAYLNFGNFWAPGCPGEWLGFSEFKSQFGITFIEHPNTLGRWAGTLKENFFPRKTQA